MNKESLLQKLNHVLKTENVVNFSYKKKMVNLDMLEVQKT